MTLLPFQQCLPKNYGSNGRPLEGTSSSDGADEAEGLQLRDDFMWGFATASAQIEGGGEDKEKASGRGRSVSRRVGIQRLGQQEGNMTDLGHAVRPSWSYRRWRKGLRHMQSPRHVQGGHSE
jgi:hypothetical protein